MQPKIKKFNHLPAELKIETAPNLSNRDLATLAQTSTYHLALFKPMMAVRKLLHHVVRGEPEAVKAMLKQDIRLLFARGIVTDCSGREFNNISGFEYALWALDKHMWAAMIACIPENEAGKTVFELLLTQYNNVNTMGVTYRLNGQTITEKHFDFKNTIIKELQKQVDKHCGDIDKQWREGVGGAQKRLPMHVVYEYCSHEPFHPVPEFISRPNSSKQFYNLTTSMDEHWFSADSKLPVEFAIYKGEARIAFAPVSLLELIDAWGGCNWRMQRDLDAMTALCKVRTNDFIDLKSQLENQMTLDNPIASTLLA